MGGSVLSPLCYGLYVCYIILSIYQWRGASRMLLRVIVSVSGRVGVGMGVECEGEREREREREREA